MALSITMAKADSVLQDSPPFPTISVVIPTFNRGQLLREAVLSAAEQDHPPDEILVVDDGSTDDSTAGVTDISELVTVIRQSNRKRGAARMRGIRAAKGAYVAFLDDDDLWLPHHLKSFLAAEAEAPGKAFYGDVIGWDEKTGKQTKYLPPRSAWTDLADATLFATVLPIIGLIVPKDAALACGGFPEDPELDGSEDFVFLARLAAHIPIIRTDATSVMMREHSSRGMLSTDYIIESRRRAVKLLLEEGRNGRTLTENERQRVAAGAYRFYAALYYSDGRMRYARRNLRKLRLSVGTKDALRLAGRLWVQSFFGRRITQLLRRLKQQY